MEIEQANQTTEAAEEKLFGAVRIGSRLNRTTRLSNKDLQK
jgi:hypothetical protein